MGRIEDIREIVCMLADVDPAEVAGKSRLHTVAMARGAMVVILRKMTNLTNSQICRHLGYVQHSMCTRWPRVYEAGSNPDLTALVDESISLLKERGTLAEANMTVPELIKHRAAAIRAAMSREG